MITLQKKSNGKKIAQGRSLACLQDVITTLPKGVYSLATDGVEFSLLIKTNRGVKMQEV